MNAWLLSAGVAVLLLDIVHVTLGGREIHRPMLASAWPEPAKAVWSVVWHAVTVVMAFGGVALIAAAFLPAQALALAALPIALFLAFTLLFIGYGITRLGSLRVLPQWMSFLVISVLGIIGLLT